MSVICIHHKGMNPYFNLAAEEYLLKNFNEDIFMIWQSESSIVVGKHQNALAEINHSFVKNSQINVARRISGGGTVFHDSGNLNFTFIKTVDQIDQVNFKSFTQPIVTVLKELGIDAYTSGRNDLLIDGKKISGNAEHVFKKRVLHHGTLLFDSKLEHLKKALKVDLSRFTDKSVQSNRSEVTNISEYLSDEMTIDEFASFIFQGIKSQYKDAKEYNFSESDQTEIKKLEKEKYSTWEWIYGYSPKYSYSNFIETKTGSIEFSFEVRKGMITTTSWEGIISENLCDALDQLLVGCKHDIDTISTQIFRLNQSLKNEGISMEKLLEKIV
ncbi:lipoate--protein ligase family protein [Sunxiuqinia sp. A32]|uniref:lipoate--protein ligase family protein n=1 Tax=Sunxiuqinia sp. A32 TaxID=3461496 RepID=UPI004045AEC4